MKATAFLLRQHRKIQGLLGALKSDGYRRHRVLLEVMEQLSAHIAIETSLLYPAARRALGASMKREHDLHRRAKELLVELASANSSGDEFLERVDELGRVFDMHVALEEGELLPAVARTVDEDSLEELGEDLEIMAASLVAKGDARGGIALHR